MTGRPRLYDDDDRRRIAELYENPDNSLLQIGAMTGASPELIRIIASEYGLPRRPVGGTRREGPDTPYKLRRAAAHLYGDRGIPLEEIERRTGLCHGTILRCADEFGIPRRKAPINCCLAAKLFAKFKNKSAVAEILNVTRQGIDYALRRHARLAGRRDHSEHQPKEAED